MKLVRDETELAEVKIRLEAMDKDPTFVTNDTYRADAEKWPDHRISFVDKHIAYLRANPSINAEDYLSNLRLRSRARPSQR